MKLLRFFDMINESERVEGIGVQLGADARDDRVGVRDSAGAELWLSAQDIQEAGEQLLQSIILRQSTCQPLHHVTRIVGYFSRIENWNGSKVGELSDRRAGDYVVNTISPSSMPVTGESQPSKGLIMTP